MHTLRPKFNDRGAPVEATYICVKTPGGRRSWQVLLEDGSRLGNHTTVNIVGHSAYLYPPGTKLHVKIEREDP